MPKITPTMTVKEIIAVFPTAADIMQEYGLHCFSCALGGQETLSEGCNIHGFDADTSAALIDDINEALANYKPESLEVTITKEAAEAIIEIGKREGKDTMALTIAVDSMNGFCLEFTEAPDSTDTVFFAKEVPEVKVYVSPLYLLRVGGAVIDIRDGRFKLDLPEVDSCCQGGGDCSCKHDTMQS